jgi:hypothetical protein
MKQKNKIAEIKKSNALINAFYNISVDTYKIFSLAASKFKDQLYFKVVFSFKSLISLLGLFSL